LRFALATLWVLVGSALAGGVYWAFLITPESTVWALMASALLALVALLIAGVTAGGAIAILSHGFSTRTFGRALRGSAGIIPAAVLVWIVWWMAGHAETWVAMRSGQISAWFIARFGWDDVSWLFTGMRYTTAWCRWVGAGLLALSLIAGFVAIGWSTLTRFVWLTRALHPRALFLSTCWFVLLIALPWIYLVPWRPKALPASSIEFAFIVAKLALSAILFAIGATLIAYEASRTASVPADPAPVAVAA
jgi:hypothetical protein